MSGDGEATLAAAADELLAAVDAALRPWVVACVTGRWRAWRGEPESPALVASASEAADAAHASIVPALAQLLATDLDDQASTPLAVVRRAVAWPTAVLADAGVPEVERDPFAERAFPADVYDLSPASLADLGEDLREPALIWGAAKAFEHKRRHQPPRPGDTGT